MSGASSTAIDELVARIASTSGLSSGMARRIVDDVLAFHDESLQSFVVRRHRELVAEGWKNAEIFEQVRTEVTARLFRGPACSVRQIRRMVYG